MKKDLLKEKPLSNLRNITIDVDSVEDPNHTLEILVSVEFVSESMLEKAWLWDLKKQVGRLVSLVLKRWNVEKLKSSKL